jgi:copper resistance protein C
VVKRAGWRSARSVMTLVVGVFFVCLLGVPAFAHTDLISVDPADTARLAQVPGEVTLEFSEEMNPELSTATLQVDDSAPTTLDLANGRSASTLVATVPASMTVEPDAVSRWRVAYRVVSADGHPVAGESTFTVRRTDVPSEDPSGGPSSTEDTGEGSEGAAAPTRNAEDRETGIPWALVALPVGVLILLLLAVLAVMRLLKLDQDA